MKINNYLRPVLAAFVLVLAASCVKEEYGGEIPAAGGGQATVGFSYSVDAVVSADGIETLDVPATRVVPGFTDDSGIAVKSMWILQFEGKAASSRMLGAPRFLDEDDLATNSISLIENASDCYTVFVANLGSNYSWGMSTASTFADVITRVKGLTTEAQTYETVGGVQTLLMSCVTTTPIVNGGNIAVNFTRNVAKVTLRLSVDASQTGMEVVSVRLRGIPSSIVYADAAVSLLGSYDDNITVMDYAPVTSGMPAPGGSAVDFSWYVPRNMRGTSSATTSYEKTQFAPNYATYFEVVATKGGKTAQFRVYPGTGGAASFNDYNIYPNKHYTVGLTIDGIDGDVNDSRVTTYPDVDFSSTLHGRMSNSFILNPAPSGTGARKFVIPIDQVNRYWHDTAEGYGQNADGIGASDEWLVSVLWNDYGSDNAGITLSRAAGVGPDDTFEVTVPAGTAPGNFLVYLRRKISDSPVTYGSPLWSWHFWVTDYNPDSFNKSAIASGTYTYPVSGGQVERYGDCVVSGQPSDLWATTYRDQVMMDRSLGAVDTYFTRSFTNDAVAANKGILHYQFGRKDPMPVYVAYGSGVQTAAGTVSIREAVASPNVFYTVASGNWTTQVSSTGIEWNDPKATTTTKSIYDPCPPGWRMPANGTWNDLNRQSAEGDRITVMNSQRDLAWTHGRGIGTVSGQVLGLRYWPGTAVADPVGGRIWYPTTGYRNLSGVVSLVGGYGHYWSATPSSTTYGRHLYFYASGVYPTSTSNRAYGFVARCVSE